MCSLDTYIAPVYIYIFIKYNIFINIVLNIFIKYYIY